MLFTALLTSSSVNAAPGASAPAMGAGSPSGPVFMQPNDPHNTLHLTIAQQQAMSINIAKFRQQAEAIVANKSLTDAQKRTKFLALQTQAMKAQLASMTPQQLQQIKARNATLENYQKSILQLRSGIQAQQQMLLKSLTPDQKKQADAIDLDVRSYANTLQNDKTMQPEEKSAKFHARTDAANQKLMSIYSPQQKAIVEKLTDQEREYDSLLRLYQTAASQ